MDAWTDLPAAALAGVAAGSYLMGGVPTGPLAARRAGVDLGRVGSGNVGATNVYRALGFKTALLVFAGDALKGLLPVVAARWWLGPGFPEWTAALMAVLGHVFNPLLGGKGGKGVATGFGAMLGVSPPAAGTALLMWIIIMSIRRIVSEASLAAALALVPLTWLFGGPGRFGETAVSALIVLLVVFSHRENLRRIWEGREKRIGREGGGPPGKE